MRTWTYRNRWLLFGMVSSALGMALWGWFGVLAAMALGVVLTFLEAEIRLLREMFRYGDERLAERRRKRLIEQGKRF